MRTITIFLIIVLGGALQAAIIIDDFSTTQVGDGYATGAGILGGERDVSTGPNASVNINSDFPGQLFCEKTASTGSWAYMTYDGVDGSGGGGAGGLGHQDLTGGGQYTGFLLTLTDISGSGGHGSIMLGQTDREDMVADFDLPTQPGDIFVPFSSFEIVIWADPRPSYDTFPFEFTDVGYISLSVYPPASGSCTIDSFTVVPEPATMLLFGLGGIALRRKRQR